MLETTRLNADTSDGIEESWSHVLTDLGIPNATLVWPRPQDTNRIFHRVYRCGDQIYKIDLRSQLPENRYRFGNLREEYDILASCRDLERIPTAIAYFERGDYQVAMYQVIAGDTWDVESLNLFSVLRHLCQVARILIQLTHRGIAHRDLRSHNVWLTEKGEIALLDFDKAKRTSRVRTFYENFLKSNDSKTGFYGSFAGLLARVITPKIPRAILLGLLLLRWIVSLPCRIARRAVIGLRDFLVRRDTGVKEL